MGMQDLQELFVTELRDVLSAEKQLIKALPKMAKAASSTELREGFIRHLAQTETHVKRLEQVFATVDETPRAKTCKAMEGLIEEGAEIIKEDAEPDVKDAALIAAAQKVEHYEIATYGTLTTWAKLLKNKKAAALLEETLEEERMTDQELTELAVGGINDAANQ